MAGRTELPVSSPTGGVNPSAPWVEPWPAPATGPKEAPSPSDAPIERPASWWTRWHLSLVLLVVVAAAGYFAVSWWRFQEFYDTNWDLGINMQALWSTTHGYVLYESGDYETAGLKSLLSLHSTYIGIPVAYLYALAPGAATLFALQASVVAFSAVPLYLIGRRAGLPESWLIAGLAVYLLTFTISSAILYDFHWEAFLPAEFAWTYYLWTQRRYYLAIVPAVVGVLTLEVFPFLLVGLVLYTAYPAIRQLVRQPAASLRSVWSDLGGHVRRALPAISLLAFAVVGYVVLRVAQHDLIPALVGTAPKSLASQVSLGYSQLFGVVATSHTIVPSLVYWLLLFAAFGFIPLLTRQSLLLLSVPWFWASVFVDPGYSSAFGNQYAFVALATVAIAFMEGLAAVHRATTEVEAKALLPLEWLVVVVPFFILALLASPQLLRPTVEGEELAAGMAVIVVAVLGLVLLSRSRTRADAWTVWETRSRIVDPDTGATYRQTTRLRTRVPRSSVPPRLQELTRFRPRAGPLVAGILVIVVLCNLALSPFSPGNFQATVYPGYRFSTAGNPAYADLSDLLAPLPKGATIVASDNLFPYVADDVHAYSLLFANPTGAPYLPFNSTHLPPYVLLSLSEWSAVPNFLRNSIFNASQYGVVSMIYYPPYPDSIYLFQAGYVGPTDILQATPFPDSMTICPSSFSLGASGALVSADGTRCGDEIVSSPAANLSGNGHTVWFGPYMTLLPGQYAVTMSLKGGVDAGKAGKTNILLLNGGGYGVSPAWYSFNLNGTQLSATTWTNITVDLNLTWPVAGVEFRGYLDFNGSVKPVVANGFVDLNYVEVDRISP